MGKQYSVHQRQEILSSLAASGLTQAAFAKREGMSVSALGRWKQDAGGEPKFVKIEPPKELKTGSIRIEVGNFRIFAEENFNEALLLQILRGVKSLC